MKPAYVPRGAGVDAGARMGGEALDVRLVDHGLGERPLQRPVALPVVRRESTTTLFIDGPPPSGGAVRQRGRARRGR